MVFRANNPKCAKGEGRIMWETYHGSSSAIASVISALIFALCFVFAASSLLIKLINEKTSRVREGLKIMGVSEGEWIVSHLIATIIPFIFLSPIMFIALLSFGAVASIAAYFILILGCLAMFAIAYIISAFFDRPKIASFLFLIGMIASSAGLYSTMSHDKPLLQQTLMSLFAPIAVANGIHSIFKYHSLAQMSAIFGMETTMEFAAQPMPLIVCLSMIIFDIVIYVIIGMYLHAVVPSKFGPRLPWNYLLQRQSPSSSASSAGHSMVTGDKIEPLSDDDLRGCSSSGVSIRDLRMTFNSGEVVAVDGLSIDMIPGQVFALLGPNGAGKTSTIDCLTGIYRPDSGSVYVGGHDALNQMDQVRSNLGVCPQFDVLFDDMNVLQHLVFFAQLKGATASSAQVEAISMLKKLDLVGKARALPQTLSGGQKRKLSVAIAFIGGSGVVILDEPSSGMDVESRHELWALIKEFRAGRCIILTTHLMTEAEVLGDRIGIMAQGKLVCCGTTAFLKNQFDIGYLLTITFSDGAAMSERRATVANCMSAIPGAKCNSPVDTQALVTLPFNQGHLFSTFLKSLDDKTTIIKSYTVNVSTLEQIFVEVANNGIRKSTAVTDDDEARSTFNEVPLMGEHHTCGFLSQLLCLMWVRLSMLRRDVYLLFMIMIFLAIGTVGFYIIDSSSGSTESPFKFGQKTVFAEQINAKHPITLFIAPSDPIFAALTAEPIDGVIVKKLGATTTGKESLFQWWEIQRTNGLSVPFRVTRNSQWLQVDHGFRQVPLQLQAAIYQILLAKDPSMAVRSGVFTGLSFKGGVTQFQYQSYSNVNKHQIERSKEDGARTPQGLYSFIPMILMFLLLILMPAMIGASDIVLRTSGAQMRLVMNGVNIVNYWIVAIFVNFIIFFSISLSILAIYFAFFGSVVTTFATMTSVIAPYCLSSTTLVALFSLLFKQESPLSNMVRILFIATGPVLFGMDCLVPILLRSSSETTSVPSPFIGFAIFPSNSLIHGFASFHLPPDAAEELGVTWVTNGQSNSIMFALVSAFVFLIIIIIAETNRLYPAIARRLFGSSPPRATTGSDPTDENTLISVDNITKDYPPTLIRRLRGDHPLRAVDGFSFNVKSGECFGHLGTNGAGKTTAMKCVIGEELSTSGSIRVAHVDVEKSIVEARSAITYCPQEDALIPGLNAFDHLALFGRLHGIPSDRLSTVIPAIIEGVSLEKFADRDAGTYSGGNRRKLSAAITLLGSRPVIILDEPTTGIDPASRRLIWDVIRAARSRPGRCAILTTHILEEAEALCTRLSIMVDGRIRCHGTLPELKAQYGASYVVEVMGPSLDAMEKLTATMLTAFAGSILLDQVSTMARISIPQSNSCHLPDLFERMEAIKVNSPGQLTRYFVGETSLEQIFIAMGNSSAKSAIH